jgi:hypothetical protein
LGSTSFLARVLAVGSQDSPSRPRVLRRWRFTEIMDDSFHWIVEVTPDGGAAWTLQVDLFARRR